MLNIIHHQGNKTFTSYHFTPDAIAVTETPTSADVEKSESSQGLLVEM